MRSRMVSDLAFAATLLFCVAAFGCRTDRSFMWVDSIPKSQLVTDLTYEIAPGDLIGITVWNQPANSVERARVREDGRISMPFLNDVEVAGLQPPELARILEAKLKTFIVSPSVTVLVHERRPLRVSVIGKVAHPGVFEVERGAGVLHAIAAAGGLTSFADEDRVFVLRRGYWADGHSEPARIRFRYGELRTGKPPASVFLLRVGDIVVVE